MSGLDDVQILQNVMSQQGGMPARDEAIISSLISGGGPPPMRATDRDGAILSGLLGGQAPLRVTFDDQAVERRLPEGTLRDEAILSSLLGGSNKGYHEQAPVFGRDFGGTQDVALLSSLLAGSQDQDHDIELLTDLMQQSSAARQGDIDDAVMARFLQKSADLERTGPRNERDDVVLNQVLREGSHGISRQRDDQALKRLMSPARSVYNRRAPANLPRRSSVKAATAPTSTSVPLLVAESLNHFMLQWPKGRVDAVVVAGGSGKGNQLHQLFRPVGIALDGSGGLVVADNGNRRVVRWTYSSTCGEVIAEGHSQYQNWFDPIDVVVTAAGDMLVSLSGGVELWRYGASSGEVVAVNVNTAYLDGEARTSWPAGLALDTEGSSSALLFADMLDNCVCMREFSSQSPLSEIVAGESRDTRPPGSSGCQAGDKANQLHRPFGLAVDQGGGAFFVADSANHRIVRWERGATQGVVVAGGKGAGNRLDQLHCPRGVLVDTTGAILVADTFNHRVMRWPRGAKRGELVAGGCGQGHRVNQLNQPNGLAIDPEGSLYIADTGNHRVVRWAIRC